MTEGLKTYSIGCTDVVSPISNSLHFQQQSTRNGLQYKENISLQDRCSRNELSNQTKIGPLGRKKSSNTLARRTPMKPYRSEAPDSTWLRDSKDAAGRIITKLRKKPIVEETTKESSPVTKRPRISLFSLGGPASSSKSAQIESMNLLCYNGLAAIHIATQNNNVARIDELIRRGADVNVKSSFDNATPLHLAARYNCPRAVEVLLQYGADVTDALLNGQTALHVCSRRGFLDVVKVLIYIGKADVNSRDKDKTTPLHLATVKGDVKVCAFLIENGAQIRAMDINQVTPLMQAAHCGFTECVHFLLSLAHQSEIPLDEFISDKDNEGNTALHLAVGNRQINAARSLIQRGAHVNCKKTTNGFTPLHQAAIIGEKELAEMLIDKGAETEIIDNEDMTPLHRAALYNRQDMILLLIRQGLYLDTKDRDNFTPFLCAAWKGQTEAGRILLRYGADIKAQDRQMKTCLHWAVEMQHLKFAKMLFEHGHGGKEIKDWADRYEQTPLHVAAEVGNVQVLNTLIENGVDLMVKDIEEKAPLHIASQCGHLECVDALLQACPVPLSDDDIDDMTPLLLASQNGHHGVVKFLIKMGADIGSRNNDRRSALALAAMNNELQVLNVLINNNANVNATDKDQNTALHLCAQAGHDSSAILLLNSGADVLYQNIYGKYPLDVAIENKHENVAKAILSCGSWEIAMNNCDATGHTPMRRLIAVMPEAARQVMDQCVTRSHGDPNHPELKITYDYRYIDPGPDDISYDKTKVRYFGLETMVDHRREKLLAHDLSQTNLSMKWIKFASYFSYIQFFWYLTFSVLVSWYIKWSLSLVSQFDRDNQFDSDGCPVLIYNTSETDLDSVPYVWQKEKWMNNGTIVQIYPSLHYSYAAELLILSFVGLRATFEIVYMVQQRLSYFARGENYLHWLMIIPMCISFVSGGSLLCNLHWTWSAVAVFFTWMNFIFVLQRFDFFGLYVTMFYTTLRSLLKAMSVYIFFIIGFALAFIICFQSTNEAFRDEWQSFITTFVMTLGEINKSDLLDTGEPIHPFGTVASVLLVIFLFLMPMVLINLTIGISVGDIDQIMESSYFKRSSLQASIIHGTEKRFPAWLQRKLWLRSAEYWPNKHNSSVWHKIKSYLGGSSRTFLRKTADETHKDITVHDIFAEVQRHKSALSTLSAMVHQQGNLLLRIAEKHDIKVDQADLFDGATIGHGRRPI